KTNQVDPSKLPQTTGKLEVNSFVAAKVEGGNDYHYSYITKVEGESFEVKTYFYQYTYTVLKQDLLVIPAENNFAVGDSVFAVWTNGRFYDGILGKIENNGAWVKWSDGSKESFVEFIMMIKR
ncbi:MAG: hypothetical protein ABIJ16_09870, partial [Bacteroidota bacterium]